MSQLDNEENRVSDAEGSGASAKKSRGTVYLALGIALLLVLMIAFNMN